MTPLRKKMTEEMQLCCFSEATQEAYQRAVTGLAGYYNLSPDNIDPDQLKGCLLYLAGEPGGEGEKGEPGKRDKEIKPDKLC